MKIKEKILIEFGYDGLEYTEEAKNIMRSVDLTLSEVEKVIDELFNSESYQNDLCSDINKDLKQKLGGDLK